jgi:hypothetical protein
MLERENLLSNVTATRTNHNKYANHRKEPPHNRSVGKSEGKEHGSQLEQYTVREIQVYMTQGVPEKRNGFRNEMTS